MPKKRPTKTGIDAYKEFLENVELYAIGLDSLSADLRRSLYGSAPNFVNKIKSSFSVSEFDLDHFDLTAEFFLNVEDDSSNSLLEIKAVYSAHFHPKSGDFKQAQVERFAEAEARLIFWPYFRQIVSDLTGRMHIRPLTIPLGL